MMRSQFSTILYAEDDMHTPRGHSAIGPRLESARRCGTARRMPTQHFDIYIQEFKQQEEHFMRKHQDEWIHDSTKTTAKRRA